MSQRRTCASACGWVATERTSASSVPGRAISSKVTARYTSSAMISGSPLASSSSVAGTAPSTEFSSGTRAASAVPERTASMASVTLLIGNRSAPAATGRARSAWCANVPSGPRKAIVVTRASVEPDSGGLAAQQAASLRHGRGDRLLLLGRQLVLALPGGDALGVDACVTGAGDRADGDA